VNIPSVSWATAGSAIVTAVVCSLGAWVFLDDRYAHAADVKAQTATLATQIEYAGDRNSKRYIEDQLFRLDQIPDSKKSDAERAQAMKYRRDLQSLLRTWEQRGMPLR
jgi:hypothetical protein